MYSSFFSKYFGKHGQVIRSTIVRDHTTNESKGFGFVELTDMDEATKALNGTNLTLLDTKMLSVEFAKIPEAGGGGPRPMPVGAGGLPMIIPPKAPMIQRREPKSRHQNDGDGGFNAPRGFADAATEVKTGLTVFDEAWTTTNVPAAAAIAGTNLPPKAGPIMKDGKMIAWGVPQDEKLIGTVAPPQGAPESTCRAQRLAALQPNGAPHQGQYDWNALQNFAGPTLPTPGGGGFGGPPGGGFGGGFGGPPQFGGRGGPPPFARGY